MKSLKKILAVVVCIAMMLPTLAFAANPSPAKVDIAGATVTVSAMTYTGSAQTAQLTVVIDGKTLVAGTDYTVSGQTTAKNAGSYSVTVTGMGNYTGELTVSYTVAPKKVDVTASTPNKYYTGDVVVSTPTVKVGSKVLTEGVDYTVKGSKGVKVGVHKMVITGKGNYSFSKTLYYRIKYSLPKTSVAAAATTTYNGKYQAAKIVVKHGSKVLVKGTDYTVSGTTKAKNAGKYAIKISGKGNYAASKTIYYTIKKANQTTVKVATNNTTKRIAVTGVKGSAPVKYTTNNTKVKISGGRVVIGRGVKKGTIVKITVKVGATANFNGYTKTVSYRVR